MTKHAVWLMTAAVALACAKDDENVTMPEDAVQQTITSIGQSTALPASYTLEGLKALGAQVVEAGPVAFAIGYRQVTPVNQDPVLCKFEQGELVWERTDLETTGDDSRGYGLMWDGAQTLYAVFSTTGTQGDAVQDFRRFAQNGWFTSYGQGGGAKAAVIARINTSTGEPEAATFAMSRLQNGNTNTLVIHSLDLLNNGNIRIGADAWYSPLRASKQPFDCSGSSPFGYTLVLNRDLSMAVSATATGCE